LKNVHYTKNGLILIQKGGLPSPKLIYVDSNNDQDIWKTLRVFTNTLAWKQGPGRLLKFYVIDDVTQKYLGVISLASDFIGIGGRDKIIGWNNEHKLKRGMLKHTMIGSTLSPTQPFGYNYLGGKLMALLCVSDEVEKVFNNKYQEKLAGITTTSLYGGYSQYTGLKYWKKCESSNGDIELEPTEDVYIKLKDWFRTEYSDLYLKFSETRRLKKYMLMFLYKELGIKVYPNNAPRGVYWCPLFENTNEFLRMDCNELRNRKFDNSVETLIKVWKNKYLSKRLSQNKIIVDILYYDDIIGCEWEYVKNKYLRDVGR